MIGEDGRMTAAAGERFEGMTALEAREAVVAALRAEGRVARTEQYRHDVPYSQRSGERIEPLISLQWFMRMDELAKPAIDVVRDGPHPHPSREPAPPLPRVDGEHPARGASRASSGGATRSPSGTAATRPTPGWSRRRATAGSATRTCSTRGSRARCGRSSRSGGRSRPPALRAFYPTDVLSTARDILFLWVARMVMIGIEFAGDIPFDDVNVHPVIQAPDGRRMSKSLGTGIDPLHLIDGGPRPPVFEQGGDFPAYGADAVRFGLLASSSTQDVRFNEEKIAQGRQLANKLWNAARLVLLRVPEDATVPAAAPAPGGRRGRVDPVAPAGRQGGGRALDRRVRVPPRRARPLRLRLRRPVRLVPGDGQAAAVRGRATRRRRASSRCTCSPRRWRSRTRSSRS